MFNLSEKNLIIGLAHPVHFQFRELSLKYLVSLYGQSLVNTRVRGLSASCPFPWIFKNFMSVSASVSAISNYFLSMSADKDGQRCPQIDLSLSTCVCTTPVSSDFVVEKTTIFFAIFDIWFIWQSVSSHSFIQFELSRFWIRQDLYNKHHLSFEFLQSWKNLKMHIEKPKIWGIKESWLGSAASDWLILMESQIRLAEIAMELAFIWNSLWVLKSEFTKRSLSVKYIWITINVHPNVRNTEPFKVD